MVRFSNSGLSRPPPNKRSSSTRKNVKRLNRAPSADLRAFAPSSHRCRWHLSLGEGSCWNSVLSLPEHSDSMHWLGEWLTQRLESAVRPFLAPWNRSIERTVRNPNHQPSLLGCSRCWVCRLLEALASLPCLEMAQRMRFHWDYSDRCSLERKSMIESIGGRNERKTHIERVHCHCEGRPVRSATVLG